MPRDSTIRRHAARIAREIRRIEREGPAANAGDMSCIRSLVLLDRFADDLEDNDLKYLVEVVEVEYRNLGCIQDAG